MIGLTNLEAYESVFNITEQIIELELYADTFDESSFEESKVELEEILSISNNTRSHLQHDIIEPRNIQAYVKIRKEKSSTDGYILILLGYAKSTFRDFERYMRTVGGLDEDDIQFI